MCYRCIGATNKALAKRRAAEDALRIIAAKEAAVAAAAVDQQVAELEAAVNVSGLVAMAVDNPGNPGPPASSLAAAAATATTSTVQVL